MQDVDRRSAGANGGKRRASGSRFGDLSDRFARAFSANGRTDGEPDEHDLDYVDHGEREVAWDDVLPRFPITRQGYECRAVDEHVADLEQELNDLEREIGELKARAVPRTDVNGEIQRIGEQTSAILVAAHEQAAQTRNEAQEQADRCVAEAASNAVSITAEANRRLQDLQVQALALRHEHVKMLDDMRDLAATITSVAEAARDRMPPEPEPTAQLPWTPGQTVAGEQARVAQAPRVEPPKVTPGPAAAQPFDADRATKD
jgi:cell division septum initiation protein DivIVA